MTTGPVLLDAHKLFSNLFRGQWTTGPVTHQDVPRCRFFFNLFIWLNKVCNNETPVIYQEIIIIKIIKIIVYWICSFLIENNWDMMRWKLFKLLSENCDLASEPYTLRSPIRTWTVIPYQGVATTQFNFHSWNWISF